MNFEYIKYSALQVELYSFLTKEKLTKIYSLARYHYPYECCGLILKKGIKPCKNIQHQLHQDNPIAYPKDMTEGFVLSSEDALFLSRNVFNPENPVKVIYHSHPDVGAYFSNEDRQNALFEDEAIYPVDHLVIDVQKNEVVCSKLFRFLEGDYQLIAIFPGQKI